jgi:hypothetical protein
MLYVDIPDRQTLRSLIGTRADACVSIYLPTTAHTQDIDRARIAFGNLTRTARTQLEDAGVDKRRVLQLLEAFEHLAEDDEFWRFQSRSLAVLATPDRILTFRLANRLSEIVEVSDRFHLKPLMRAVTFPHAALLLALSENAVRVVEITAGDAPQLVRVPEMPTDAASAVGKSTINDRSPSRRIHGSEGQKVQLTKYARAVSAALSKVLSGRAVPVVLAATEPLASLFRQVTPLEVLPGTVTGAIDTMTEAELAEAASAVLDQSYAASVAAFGALYAERASVDRAVSDVASAARAATFGAIDTIMVDMDSVINGYVDEETGAVTFDAAPNASNYGVVDEIAGRAFLTGAAVMAVRRDDMPGGGQLAAILRYAL